MSTSQFIFINSKQQSMSCFNNDDIQKMYFTISTAKNGLGEQQGSECTPRGWHRIYNTIGLDRDENSVFVGRKWTGEIYNTELAKLYPGRDWILTRIIQLDGIEPGRNKGGAVDSLNRYIYIHGTPDSTYLGQPGSKGCIRLANKDIIKLANWVTIGALVYIE